MGPTLAHLDLIVFRLSVIRSHFLPIVALLLFFGILSSVLYLCVLWGHAFAVFLGSVQPIFKVGFEIIDLCLAVKRRQPTCI